MDELSELIWKDFKFKHKNFPEPHLERYNEQRFKREFTVYKIGHFATRIVELTDKFELPFNSILHVLDNVNQPVYQDTPRIEENEFIQRESGRKFIYHITELNTKGPIIYPDKYILRFAGLPTKLMKFRQEQKNNFRYLNSIDEFPTNPMYLTVVNHNPLFRMRMFGRLQFFRTTQQILASIFNTCTEMTKLNKHQFVLIPWSDEVFDKQMFVRSRTELSFTTVKRPESFHYIFMMHLVNYMFDKDTTSMFEKLDETTLSQVTLILKHNDKYLFLNLKDIKDLNVKNVAYFRFINQLNLLALLGNKQIDMSHPEVTKLIEENTTELGTEYSIKGTTTVTDTDTNFKLEPEVTQVTDEHTESIISKIVNTVLPKKTIVPVVGANSHTTIPEQKEIIRTIEPSGKQTAKRVAIVDRTNNISKIKSTNLNSDTYAEEYIRDLDKATEEFIDNNEDLTPAAKTHFKKLATKYKTCMVGGVPIDKLLRDHSDISLTEDKIDKKVMGYIPDESMLNSSTATFEKDYVRKTFNKHLAGVITSFQKNGVFLVNVEQKVVADPLNNYTIYTCTYEDIHSKRSTVKFKMPNIDANDRFVTDGNKQVIKKQRCVLPIVKINEREVSLASNYNKTRVVRNETKAHSYSGYIDKILDKDKSTAKLVYGNLSINESISYEYCVMASKFMSIEFQHGKKHYYLVFNYYHRLASFGESAEKLDKLESLYGIYFGHTEDEYLFVDNANSVFSVYKKGGENVDFEATTIVDVLKLSLKPGVNEPKPLSEYVTIKILNAELPVVFMLAYKYGLRNTLEYLGAKYTITENRSKTIIGENVATESFGVNSDRVAGADDLEIIYGKDWIKPNNDSKPSITIINRRPEQDETDVTVDQSREHDPIYTIGTEGIWNDNYAKQDPHLVAEALEWQEKCNVIFKAINKKYTKSLSDKEVIELVKSKLRTGGTRLVLTLTDLNKLDDKYHIRQLEFDGENVYPPAQIFTGCHRASAWGKGVMPLFEQMCKDEETHPSAVKLAREVLFGHEVYIIKHIIEDILSWRKRGANLSKELVESILVYLTAHEEGHSNAPRDVVDQCLRDKNTNAHEIFANKAGYEALTRWSRSKLSAVDLRDTGDDNRDIVSSVYSPLIINPSALVSLEAIDRPVKPRLGKIQFFISVNKSNDELNPYTVKIRGMLIEVKLGLSNTVPRRVINYDGLTFKTTDPKKLSKQLVEKAADYLHCGERKISMASVNVIDSDAPTPPAVAKAKQMSTEEYAKLTSKLVNDDTRVGGNESFEVIPNSSPSMGIIEKIIDSIIHVSRRLHEGKVFYYVTVKLVSLKTKTIGINHASVYKFEKGHKRTVGAVNELFPRKWDAKSKEDIQRILDEITDICKQSKYGDHEVVLGGDTAKIIYQLGKRFDEEEKAGNESFEISMEDLSENVKYDPQPHDIHIRFADRVLHFNRYPLKYSLILSGLAAYDLSGYAMSEFESKDVYYDLFINNGLAANYLKGIDSFYDLFIDNMTYTVLKQMHEPTNVRDLLIRCSELLSSVDHKEASSAANHRIRGYEQFNAILYNEMSREFAGYQARRGKANTFSINANAVYLRIIQNESTMPAEAANPMEDIKIYSNITYGGIGGRTGESFVTVDRRYSADDVGVLSEATADSGKVGMNAMLSFDPTIKNTMGVIETKDPKELKPSNIISASAALMPYAVNDDCNRLNFISIQYSHVMNTECVDRNRIRTGYERVIAHRVSDNFAATAEQDGKVTKIDNVAKLMEVTYKDGTKTVFKIGDHYELAESIVIQNNIKPNFKEGDTFKKDDVLTYNEGYFNRDYFTGQVDMSTGVMANLCLLETDTTLEDATEISESLSKKLAINPVNERVVTMSAKSQIFTMAKIGDHVKVTDPLCIFDEEPLTQDPGLTEDEDALAILGDISKSAPTAKFSGEIVHIAVYCGCEVSEMSPSVANVVKAAYVETAAQAKLAKDTARANEFVKPTIVPKGSRFKGIEFDEDTVMIIFYIKERIVHGVGDKLVLCNQLKSTVAAVFPKPVTTESGIPIDVLYSQKGVNSRKVLSPFLTGILSRLVEKVEKDVVDEYFK